MDKIVTIIGYGDRGQAWTRRAVKSGWAVRVFDPEGELDPLHPQVTQHTLISSAVADCDLIVLCLPDRLALQRKIIQHIQTLCSPQTPLLGMSVLATVEDLQSCAKWPGSVVHAGMPAKGTVSLITTSSNARDGVLHTRDLITMLGFETVVSQGDDMFIQ